jgi:hypothetical protein
VAQAFAAYAAQLAASESRLRRAGRIDEVPDAGTPADNATESTEDAASQDSATEQAFELEVDDDALNHSVEALGNAINALKESANAPCLGPPARETKAGDGTEAAALPARRRAVAFGLDETAPLDPVVVADARDARGLSEALKDLQRALASLDAASASNDSRTCTDAKAAMGLVLDDLEAVLRAKRRASSAAHRLALSGTDDWDAEHAYAAAIQDERAAVLEARSAVQAVADDPYDKMAAGPAFETFAMRLDSSMTWLGQVGVFPVPVAPTGRPAVSPRAAYALRQALAPLTAALDGVRVEAAASCANVEPGRSPRSPSGDNARRATRRQSWPVTAPTSALGGT